MRGVIKHPSLEAEISYAVARGSLEMDAAMDVAFAIHIRSPAEARQKAEEVRRGTAVWAHILEQLRARVRDEAHMHIRIRSPKNVMLAACHEINRNQNLQEEEVTEIVVEEVWRSLPDPPRRRHVR